MRRKRLDYLNQQEQFLYLEIEQLRSSLYLHDQSVVFEFFSLFYFATQDIKKLLIKKREEKSLIKRREKSIISLLRKRKMLLFLSKTPYAWLIFSMRNVINILFSHTKQFETNGSIEKSKKKVFIIYGSTGSHDLQSRSVQIARKLAEKNKVMYIEGMFDEGKRTGYRIIEESECFTAIRLSTKKPFHLNYQKPSPKEILFLRRSLKLINSLTRKSTNSSIYIHHPFWSLILPLKKRLFMFDHADDFAHGHHGAKHIVAAEKKLLKGAHIVTTPHLKLYRGKKDFLIKNGVDWNHFQDTSKMIQTCDVGLCWIKKPVIGFIGTLDERFDEVLLGKLASAFPTASLVLVGNTDYRPVIEVAERYPNIFPVGRQSYKKLPLFLQSFDILIAPYKKTPHMIGDHPELPLYLTSGKPTVITSSEMYKNKRNYIYQPTSHLDWIDTVKEALREKKRSKKKYLRIADAKKSTWKSPKFG